MSRIRLWTALVAISFFSLSSASVWAAYTDKTTHESGDEHVYKHPDQPSFTGPFDYAPAEVNKTAPKPRVKKPAPPKPTGKCNVFTFDATESHDVDRDQLTVLWEFGDGQTSTEPVVTHAYEKAGDYTVTLTVKDSSGQICDTGIDTTVVSANFPAVAVAGEAKRTCVGDPVSFDSLGSSSSSPATYTWDFGDAQVLEGTKVTHAYEEPGVYKVILTVDDNKDTDCSIAQASTSVTVYERPTLLLSGPKNACTGRTVVFNTQITGGPMHYRWDFGDGTVLESTGQVSHKYEIGGTFKISVTADNGLEMPCSVVSDQLTVVVNSTPVADAGENLACCIDKPVSFDGSRSHDPDGGTLTYRWDFGDGESAQGAQATHTYMQSGEYQVVLTVQDDSGSDCGIGSDTFVARVNTGPEAVIKVR